MDPKLTEEMAYLFAWLKYFQMNGLKSHTGTWTINRKATCPFSESLKISSMAFSSCSSPLEMTTDKGNNSFQS